MLVGMNAHLKRMNVFLLDDRAMSTSFLQWDSEPRVDHCNSVAFLEIPAAPQ